jgi:hypothetical protein
MNWLPTCCTLHLVSMMECFRYHFDCDPKVRISLEGPRHFFEGFVAET